MKKGFFFVVGMVVGLFFLLNSLTQVQAAEVVKIGVLGPTTGGAAVVGTDILRALKMGAKEINDRGGLNIGNKKYHVEIVDMDDGAVVANSVANARRMVSMHKTPVIIGPPISSCALAILEFNDKKPNPFLIMTMAMHPDITKRGNKLIIRPNTPTRILGHQLAGIVFKHKKPQSIAIIHHTDDWGMTWKQGLEETAVKNNVKITDIEGIDERKQTDYYVQLTKIVEKKPDAIFLVAHDAATAMMVKQVREIGYKGRLVFSEGFGDDGRKLVADKIEGSIWPGTPSDFNTPNVQRYRAMFKKLFPNETPKQYGPHSYDCLWIIVKAMELAQNVTDPFAIRAAAAKIMLNPLPHAINYFEPVDETGESVSRYMFAEQRGNQVVELTLTNN